MMEKEKSLIDDSLSKLNRITNQIEVVFNNNNKKFILKQNLHNYGRSQSTN